MTAEELIGTSRVYNETIGRFKQIATHFANTGVAVIEGVDFTDCSDWRDARKKHRNEGLPIPEVTQRKFARWLAKDLGRPLLIAESCGYNNQLIKLTIPRLKRHEVLVVQFFLVEEVDRHHNRVEPTRTVWRCQNGSNWEVYFQGEQGRRLLAGFIEQCRTDPTFRIALRNNLPRPVLAKEIKQAA